MVSCSSLLGNSLSIAGELARDYGNCDYDTRHNVTAQYAYQLPFNVLNHVLGHAVNGWQISGSVFWHSGVPFSGLSTPYSANGNDIVQGSGPQFASLMTGADSYFRHCNIPGVVHRNRPRETPVRRTVLQGL